MMVNVYTGCITLIYLLLSAGARTFLEDDRDKAIKKKWILRLGVSVVVSLLLSAVIVLPALRSIMEAPRSGDGNFLNTYMTALQAQWSDYEWSMVERMCVNMALPVAAIIGFVILAARSSGYVKKYRGHIFVVIALLLSVIIPSVELLWHGGSRASWPVRFIYVISFVLIDFAMLLYQDHRDRESKPSKTSTDRWLSVVISLVVCIAAGRIFYKILWSGGICNTGGRFSVPAGGSGVCRNICISVKESQEQNCGAGGFMCAACSYLCGQLCTKQRELHSFFFRISGAGQ